MEQLLDAQRSIDADSYPENAAALEAEIQRRQAGGRVEPAVAEPTVLSLPSSDRKGRRFPLVIRLWGLMILPQPLAFLWLGIEASQSGWLYPVFLIPVGFAGGAIGFGMITSARWIPRWFPIWTPFYLSAAILGYYAIEKSLATAIVLTVFLGGFLVILNQLIQQAGANLDNRAGRAAV
jgi:hypothetical protein